MKKLFVLFLSCLLTSVAYGQSEDPQRIRQIAEEYLKLQTAGLTGQPQITVGAIDNRLTLASCSNPLAFLPPGSKPWGKITVGVRCTAPTSWIVYLSANIQVTGDYYVTASNLAQGQIISSSDLTKLNGELSNLPSGSITTPSQAIGKSLNVSVASGTVVRTDNLRNPMVVQQGQSVRVTSTGKGFQVATDGQALNNASEGQVAKVKILSGQVVSGIAKAGGVIEITY
ncbi:flagellar basal body P-ring formation protein FlgA [Undibacterium sp. Jales W-56]|uniref:flagellar basal body P-ring formation chaperone FlgA n=1 Tax=Undibacterium sp. Jales W-56 TaxID=2897325 RepID=UPI0021CE192C|nr:flagellar basal body P-ring formation chaperone FlgA [Undibacterium sp. Jales W-56]MCU6433217.1 flagellar basal body P-ring formation protein FlgA [Undibacterium sp. Jales W-56]